MWVSVLFALLSIFIVLGMFLYGVYTASTPSLDADKHLQDSDPVSVYTIVAALVLFGIGFAIYFTWKSPF